MQTKMMVKIMAMIQGVECFCASFLAAEEAEISVLLVGEDEGLYD